MRRLILEEPTSAAAIWSRRLGIFGLTLGLISIGLARFSTVEVTAVFAVLGSGIMAACGALLLAAAATISIWQTGRRGTGALLGGLFFASLVLAWPVVLAVQAVRLPVLNDISTDLTDPPAFLAKPQAAGPRSGATHSDIPMAAREVQRRSYPDVQPIVLDLDMEGSWDMAQKAVAALGWTLVDQAPPSARNKMGQLDASVKSLVMALPDDISIRLRPLGAQTRLDIRSASRWGRHDFGSNARHIRAFAAELQNQLDER